MLCDMLWPEAPCFDGRFARSRSVHPKRRICSSIFATVARAPATLASASLYFGLAQIVRGLGNCALPQHLLAPFQDLFLYFEVGETSLQFGLRAEELSDGEPEFDVVVFYQRIAGRYAVSQPRIDLLDETSGQGPNVSDPARILS